MCTVHFPFLGVIFYHCYITIFHFIVVTSTADVVVGSIAVKTVPGHFPYLS